MAVQAAIWSLSGLYMTAVHIDIIHGDHLRIFARSSRTAKPVVNGGPKPVFGHGSDGDARLAELVGGVKKFEQSGCGFYEVAQGA